MNHQGRLRAWARAAVALSLGMTGALALPSPAQAAEGPVVVSLTFDDGLTSQYRIAPMLAAQNVKATFYLNSGQIDQFGGAPEGTMSWAWAKELADQGHEIGGHTLNHQRIGGASELSSEEKVRQVCADRVRLVEQGFNPTAFAYPYGDVDAAAQEIVQNCGYQSARRAGGINPTNLNLTSERLPNPYEGVYSIRVLSFADGQITAATMRTAVETAYANNGGWVPMLFHRVCHPSASSYESCRTTPGNVDVAELDAFLTWAKTHEGVSFKTVTGALGGGTPPPPPPPPADTTAPTVTVTSPANGSTVTTARPEIRGAGGTLASDEKTATVRVYSGTGTTGQALQTLNATIGTNGAWSATPAALANGTYTVRATQRDAAGNTGSGTATFTVNVGSTPPPPPPPPSGDTTAPAVSISSPSTGATVDTSRPTISGKGGTASGDQGTVAVSVYSGSSATGTPAQTSTATLGKDGAWSVTTSTLADGTYTVRATQKDAAGNTGTSNTVTFTVKAAPKPPTSKPTITKLSRATLGRGAKNATVVVTGGFRPDSVVTFSGRGVSARVLSRSATTVELAVTVARNAGMQPRHVTVKNADGGSFTCDKCFRVVKGPRIKALLQDRLERGATTWVTVRGSGFGKTTEVAVSGKAVSVRKVVVVGPRRIKVAIYVAPGAKRVARSVTVTDTVTLGSNTMPRSLRIV